MKNNWIQEYITEAFKETKESTGTGGGYGYSTPAFSMWSKDEVAKSEYKRSKKEKTEGEFKEATDSSSIGAYDYNSFQNVNMKGNTVKGNGRSWKKSQIPGGSFVEINPKCKTFPYCNQGNTGAVKYKKKSPVNEAIENVSKKTGLSINEIKNIILLSINK